MTSAPDTTRRRRDLAILAILTLPFLLNDFSNIYVRDYRVWLAIDYTLVKLAPLLVIAVLLLCQIVSFGDFGLRPVRFGQLVGWTVLLAGVGVFLDSGVGAFLAARLPDTRLGGMPPIPDPVLAQVDLYLGLGVGALLEEMIFRGLYFTVLSRYLRRTGLVFLVSAVAFGLIHWSLGLSEILHGAVIGTVFMTCMWRTGGVWPAVLAHFMVNYVAFSSMFGLL